MTSKRIPRLNFRLEISGVLFPVGRLPNAEPDCQTLSLQCVVSRQGPADSLVQHSQAVVRERLTVHLGPLTKKQPLMPPSDGFYAIMTTYRRSRRRCAVTSRHAKVRLGAAIIAQAASNFPPSASSISVDQNNLTSCH